MKREAKAVEERAVGEGKGEGAAEAEAENDAGTWPRLAFASEQTEGDVPTSHSRRFASTRQLNVAHDTWHGTLLNPGPVHSWAQAHLASSLRKDLERQGGDANGGAHESA